MSDDDESEDEPMTIECDVHGRSQSAVVCRHHVRSSDAILGYVENSTDPGDLQAWCDACEEMFLREQELTEAFRKFNDFALVCIECYARLKKLHSSPN